MLPPGHPGRRPQRVHNLEANTGLQLPLSTLHERRYRRPCKTRFRLAGCASTGRVSNPLGRFERFQVTFHSPFQDFSCRKPSRWGRYRPHPSQSRTCRFPASGSSRERFARSGIALEDPDWRQWVSGQKFVEAGPCDHASTMTPRQPLAPDANHLIGEPTQAPTVAANAIIGEVAPHHGGQVTMLVADRPVAVSPTPVIDLRLKIR